MKNSSIIRVSVISVIYLIFSGYFLNAQTFKDFDGKVYKTAKFGLQEWTPNLNSTHFSNGEIIPEARTAEEWIAAGVAKKPVWCYYDNDPENGKKYGKLYNWYAINDSRGLAPKGWHVSINADWMTLVKNLLGVDDAGIRMKSKTGWRSKNGTDQIGFSALPGGLRDEKGTFKEVGTRGQWWSNSEPVEVIKSNLIYSVSLNDFTVEVNYIKMVKESGLSVRCVKD